MIIETASIHSRWWYAWIWLIYPKRDDTDPDFVGYPFGPPRIQNRYYAAPLRTLCEISTESKSTTKSTKPGEGSLHPRPKGRGIRDPPCSPSNKDRALLWKRPLFPPTQIFCISSFVASLIPASVRTFLAFSRLSTRMISIARSALVVTKA